MGLEVGNEVASLGVQVHGGTGYVDDAEISQVYRDSRIGPIFEGTNYIQAQDLLGRKIVRDRAETLNALLDDIATTANSLPRMSPCWRGFASSSWLCSKRLREATQDLIHLAVSDVELIGSWRTTIYSGSAYWWAGGSSRWRRPTIWGTGDHRPRGFLRRAHHAAGADARNDRAARLVAHHGREAERDLKTTPRWHMANAALRTPSQ